MNKAEGMGLSQPDVFEDQVNVEIWNRHIRLAQPVLQVARDMGVSHSFVYDRLALMRAAAVPEADVALYRDLEWARSGEMLARLWQDFIAAGVEPKERATVSNAMVKLMQYRSDLKGLAMPRTHRVEIDTSNALHEEFAALCESEGLGRPVDGEIIEIES